MADNTSEPDKVPGTGGSGPFVGIAVVFALLLGGLLAWKLKGSDAPTADPAAATTGSVAANQAKPVLTDSIPPPPPVDDTKDKAGETAGNSGKKPSSAGAGTGACGGTCSGTPSGATRGDISARSAAARGCYERALRTNQSLQGKMTVNVRVDPSGQICSASISGDTVNSGDVSSCVLGAYRGQKVAPPTGGCADISQTFNFQPKNK
jgi:membrane protein involved in colicin uptake